MAALSLFFLNVDKTMIGTLKKETNNLIIIQATGRVESKDCLDRELAKGSKWPAEASHCSWGPTVIEISEHFS